MVIIENEYSESASLKQDELDRYFDHGELQASQDAIAAMLSISCVLVGINGETLTRPSLNCRYHQMRRGSSGASSFCTKECFRESADNDGRLPVTVDGETVAWWYVGQNSNMCPMKKVRKLHRIESCDQGRIRQARELMAVQLRYAVACKKQRAELDRLQCRVEYLNWHDPLTGLGNCLVLDHIMRAGFRMGCRTLGILYCDIDGLRIVNSLFGWGGGDSVLLETGRFLQRMTGCADTVIRVGGDEYLALVWDTCEEELERLAAQVIDAFPSATEAFLSLQVSMTVGATMYEGGDIHDAVGIAERRMWMKKLLENRSISSGSVLSLRRMLDEKTHETELHGWRMRKLTRKLAERLGVRPGDIAEYELLAVLHDIGKVAVPDHILNKPGPLNEEEWIVMKRHSEAGARIAGSIPQLQSISGSILYHHESWDGTGYPLGISGEQIPLPCRILAVVDAYDVMTNDRVYRKARSSEEALEELRRCSGHQFDPSVVEAFFALMEPKRGV